MYKAVFNFATFDIYLFSLIKISIWSSFMVPSSSVNMKYFFRSSFIKKMSLFNFMCMLHAYENKCLSNKIKVLHNTSADQRQPAHPHRCFPFVGHL